MQSGRDTLASIDHALAQVRGQLDDLDARIATASAAIGELQARETEKFRELARVRLEELEAGELAAGLDETERLLREQLSARDAELEAIAERIGDAERTREELEASRRRQEQQVERAEVELDEKEALAQRRLAGSVEHAAQLERASAADATADEAEAKAEQAERDRVEKGKPYESDPLFMYLWQRGYGTSAYAALAPLRFLDAKVADLCGYRRARANYAMLLEIPERLREHARRVREAADSELVALEAIEEAAAREDGVPAAREALAECERELEAIDARIGETEEGLRALMQERARYATGDDPHSRRAIELLEAQLRRDSIAALRRQARGTRGARDDVLVRELDDIEDERRRLDATLASFRELYDRHLTRLKELEQIRQDFKRSRFDDLHSTFSNEELLAGILSEFLRGVASSTDVWGTLRRHHRRRPVESDPGFGSGGFGRSGGVWRKPSGGLGRGGGFRTGGGF